MVKTAVRCVYLKLGGNCNFNCRYCAQHSSAGFKTSPVVSERVYKYIERLAENHFPKDEKIFLDLYGGEPLVYWDAIKATVERLGDSVEYVMTSNGALLTDDKVEYMNAHDIHYTLSNDGAQTAKVRGVNVLEDETIRQRFLRINNRSVNAVTHAYNQDYQALFEYLKERAPQTCLSVEPLDCTWDMPSDIYAFDFDKYRTSLRQVYETAKADIINGVCSGEVLFVESYVREFMQQVKNEDKGLTVAKKWPPCNRVRVEIVLDCDGNMYTCQDNDIRIGTVDDDYSTLLERYDALYSKIPDGCKDCECVSYCRGGCPYSRGQAGKAAMCEITRIGYEEAERFVASFADVDLKGVPLHGRADR